MEKRKFDEIIRFGNNYKYCLNSSTFEIELAKLVTACTIMPTINTSVDFYTNHGRDLKIRFYHKGIMGDVTEPIIINLDEEVQRNFQLTGIISRVHDYMDKKGILTRQDCLSKNDDILWTALDNTSDRVKYIPQSKDYVINTLANASLQINAFRKMLNSNNGHTSFKHESVLLTVLGLLDYYSKDSENNLSKVSVDATSYFKQLSDFEDIDKAIRINSLVVKDRSFNDLVAARNQSEDRVSSYLAGLYQTKINNHEFHAHDIDVTYAEILDMLSHMGYKD